MRTTISLPDDVVQLRDDLQALGFRINVSALTAQAIRDRATLLETEQAVRDRLDLLQAVARLRASRAARNRGKP